MDQRKDEYKYSCSRQCYQRTDFFASSHWRETEDFPHLGPTKEHSILQAKLTKLAIQIVYAGQLDDDAFVHSSLFSPLGMTIAILTVLVLLIRFSIEEFYMR